MKKYKGWCVVKVSSGFFGGHIVVIKKYNWLEKLLGIEPDLYPRFMVSEHWGSNNPYYGIEGLFEAARNYIDSGAKEAIETGHHTINLSPPNASA